MTGLGVDGMVDDMGEQAFRRSPAFAFWSIFWGVILGAIGLSSLSRGVFWPLLCLGLAALLLVNAWWCWRTPYIRVDGSGLTAYPSIVSHGRAVVWPDVKHVRSKGDGRLYLLGADYKGMCIRMKTVTMGEREALVNEVVRRSGRRILPMSGKPR
jgi:hypothetical protein